MKIETILSQLETAQLVRAAGEWEYLFKHTLTQETVYESLLRSTRREIHERVARTYEDLYADRLDEFAAPLAQHYAEAGNDTKTLEYSIRAGDAAARMYANTEAILHYTHAIAIAKQHATALEELFLKCGRAFEHSGQFAKALENYQAMESCARDRADRAMELAAVMARATLHATPTTVQNLDLGRVLLDHSLALARELKDRAAESKALWNLMLLEYFCGHQSQAIVFGEEALEIARDLGLREHLAFVLNDLARNYAAVGQRDPAHRALTEARALWQAMGNLPMLADNLSTAADNAASFGEYDQAMAYAQESYRISLSIGNLWNQAYSRWIMGNVHSERGELDQAQTALNETIQLGDQAGFVIAAWIARVVLAWTCGDLGLPARGIAMLEPHVERVRQIDVPFKAWGLGILGYLYLLDGNAAQARAFLDEAKQSANLFDIGALVPVVYTLTEGAYVMAHHDFARVEQMAHDLLARYAETTIHMFKSDVMLLAARALRAQNKIDESRAMLMQARAEAEALGVRRVLWAILAEWSALEERTGNREKAEALRAESRAIIEFIVAHTPDEFRASFLNLPNVRAAIG